jgi:hypothetical protein
MKNPASTNAIQGLPPVNAKKDWTKPVLDILELESAQHGSTHIPDGVLKHRSG